MGRRIIGIMGAAGVGKSTTANILAARHGFLRCGFADSLKEACGLIYELSYDQLLGGLKEEIDPRYGLTPRFIMQRFGTEVCRAIHPDTWVLSLFNRLARPHYLNADVAIEDVRFENEALAVLAHGGRLWHVVGRASSTEATQHASEAARPLHLPHRSLVNASTIPALEESVARLLSDG